MWFPTPFLQFKAHPPEMAHALLTGRRGSVQVFRPAGPVEQGRSREGAESQWRWAWDVEYNYAGGMISSPQVSRQHVSPWLMGKMTRGLCSCGPLPSCLLVSEHMA